MSLYHTKAASWQDIARVCTPTSLGPRQDNRRSRVPKLRLFLSTNHLQASRDIRKTRRCQRFSSHSLQARLPQAARGSTWSISRPPETVSVSPQLWAAEPNTAHSQPPCSLQNCHHKILQSLGCVYNKQYFFLK